MTAEEYSWQATSFGQKCMYASAVTSAEEKKLQQKFITH